MTSQSLLCVGSARQCQSPNELTRNRFRDVITLRRTIIMPVNIFKKTVALLKDIFQLFPIHFNPYS